MILDDSPAFPATFLGAMRIGAVPVPVNPMDRVDNYAYYLDDSYAKVLVVEASLLEALAPVLAARRGLHVRRRSTATPGPHASFDFVRRREHTAELPPPLDTHREDMAFWLYSSGSTGRPKGVVHAHGDIGGDGRALRPQRAADLRTGRLLLDDQAVPRLRARQRPVVPAVGGGLRRIGQGPIDARADLRGAWRAIARRCSSRCRRCTRRWSSAPGCGGRRLLIRPRVRVGGRGVAGGGARALAGASPACRSSTGSARPRCSTSTARTRSTISRPAPQDAPCRGTSCGSSTSTGLDVAPGEPGDLMVRGDSCAAYYWHQRAKTRYCDARRVVPHRRPLHRSTPTATSSTRAARTT